MVYRFPKNNLFRKLQDSNYEFLFKKHNNKRLISSFTFSIRLLKGGERPHTQCAVSAVAGDGHGRTDSSEKTNSRLCGMDQREASA